MMKKNAREIDALLERASQELRAEEPSTGMLTAAAERVWASLSHAQAEPRGTAAVPAEGEPIRSCAEYQALMPAAVAGTLPPARRLLVEDHTRECIPCRKVLRAIRAGESVLEKRSEPSGSLARQPWLRAASVVVASLIAGLFAFYFWPLSQANLARVERVDGALYQMGPSGRVALEAGDWITGGEQIRTSGGSGAVVRLKDGSLVELGERAAVEFFVRRDGERIRIGRGSIIVEAAQQGAERLKVSTDEMLVSVKGTIFAVSHGAKGSRVSVIEGEVEVNAGRQERRLFPGDQLGTGVAAYPLAFEEELGWSQNADRYLELLREFAELRQELNQLISAPEPRFSTRLLDLAPAGTTVYFAMPNPTITAAQAYQLLHERVSANPMLAEWWQQEVEAPGFGSIIDDFVEFLRTTGENLGEEVAVTLNRIDEEGVEGPAVLAEVANAMALRIVLEEKMAELEDMMEEEGFRLRLVEDPFSLAGGDGEELLVWVGEDTLVASTSVARLQEVAGSVQGNENPFVGSPFHSRLAEIYARGAEILGGVDLSRLLPELLAREELERAGPVEATGLLDAQYLLVERQQDPERAHTAASLSFVGPRRGMVSWIAEAGPMGSLDYISPEATFVAAFVIEDPADIVEELFALAGAEEEGFEAELAQIEADLGFSIRDVAATLGGELAWAIDGPALPTPAWRLVAEVYNEIGLQSVLESAADRLAGAAGEAAALGLESAEVGSRTFYRLSGRFTVGDEGVTVETEVHYTYHQGYLVAAPTRGLVERAIAIERSGTSIVQNPDFQALLPEDGYTYVSGLVFNRLGEVVQGLLERVTQSGLELSPEQRQVIGDLSSDAGPSLHTLYGEEDRIRIVSNSPSALPFLGLGEFFGLGSVFGMMEAGGAPWQP